jgi:LacI family transcriptional regulator
VDHVTEETKDSQAEPEILTSRTSPQRRARGPVSIHDVARLAGVSISTVSRALNAGSGSISEDMRRRVLDAASELKYSPNYIGRALRAQTTNTFALVLSNIQNNFYAAVAWELERLLNEKGLGMLLYASDERPDLQDRCIEDIRSRQVSGVFFLCAVPSAGLSAIATSDPVVLINRRVSGLPALPFVGIDDRAAAREFLLVALRRIKGSIGIIHGPLTSDTSARRLRGMLESCREFGVEVPDERLREARLSMESGYAAASSILAGEQPAALFCGNDPIAYGAYRRCRELGLRVPEDIAIFGFDDNPLNEWLAPWLSTVRVPHMELARRALAVMELPVALRPTEVVLPYELIFRN